MTAPRVNLDPAKVSVLVDRVRREVDEGNLPSCQIALGLGDEIVLAETFGDATPDTRYCIFSATKAFVASSIWHLIADGLIDPSARVVEYLPEFGTNGKDVITVEQVMLHTSGFPAAPLGPPAWSTHEGRLAAFAKWRLNWEPGTASEYHTTSAHWVLAELAYRVTGTDHRDLVAKRVTEPLGLPRILGLGPDEQDNIAELGPVGQPATPEELMAALGVEALPVTEVTLDAELLFNTAEVREVGVPGGGGFARAIDLAAFYQALLHNPGELWPADLLADVTGNVRNSLPDRLMGTPASRSLGLILAGADGMSALRGFGHTVSPQAFGHNGAGGQIAFADPATGLSVGFCTNGLEQNPIKEWRRTAGIASKAAVCAAPVA